MLMLQLREIAVKLIPVDDDWVCMVKSGRSARQMLSLEGSLALVRTLMASFLFAKDDGMITAVGAVAKSFRYQQSQRFAL